MLTQTHLDVIIYQCKVRVSINASDCGATTNTDNMAAPTDVSQDQTMEVESYSSAVAHLALCYEDQITDGESYSSA